MKKAKKILSLFLAALMVLTCVPISISAEEGTTYNVGDIIEYGNYPQSLVEDEELIAQLNATESEWISFEYYTGSAININDENIADGKMHPSDYMKYRDVTLGDERYRAATFSRYRMTRTGLSALAYGSYGQYECQYDNGYNRNTIYWFKYEPIKWYILDPDDGLILSESVLDSQAFNNYFLEDGDVYYGDSEMKNYASNYYYSSIRKWLTEDFYNTSFTGIQKSNIKQTAITTENLPTGDTITSNDKIFLLSSDEVENVNVNVTIGTDYAKCNGLDQQFGKTKASWWTRTPGRWGTSTSNVDYVNADGNTSMSSPVSSTGEGIRPALKLSTLKSDTQQIKEGEQNYGVGDIIEYGNYPQSKVTDEALISELDKIEKEWVSYNYYSGEGKLYESTMTVGDYMKYADFEYNNEKYRSVFFTEYRPNKVEMAGSGGSAQDGNGYYINNTYYFKFEPLQWQVINPNTGLIMCERIIDSQAFQNVFFFKESDSISRYMDPECTAYVSNYEKSSIRQWLNDNFYNSAFTNLQKSNIVTTYLNNDACYDSQYNSAPTEDKIFLLSHKEAQDIDQHILASLVTDYSLCQGLQIYTTHTATDTYDSYATMFRSAFDSKNVKVCNSYNGEIRITGSEANETGIGIRPVCRLKSLQSDTEQIKGEETNPHISWNYDGNCHLYISGEGAINYADEYGWEKYADEIMYIEVSDGITSLPENIFSALPYLTEVYFGSDVAEISSNTFSDCPLLTAVTFNGNAQINNGAFTNASKCLTFILNGETDMPKDFAEQNNIRIVTASYDTDKKALNFTGDITVFDYTKYDSLHNILCQHSDAEYLYFTKLIFADANPDISIKDDALEAETTPNGLILNNVYVRLILVNENGEQNVSFEKMLELLESGDYTAFKYNAKSDEKEEEGTLFSKIVEAVQRALQFISKLINLIRRLFKR